ncbi:MAG TPA: hypothetical protein VF553_19040 [Pyrinomonadaceae bacterium]
MKICPTCKRAYADETLTYCLDDGSLLAAAFDPEATQRIPPPRTTYPPPTQPASYDAPRPEPKRQGVNPALIYVTAPLLALIVGGGAVALYMSGNKDRALDQSRTQSSNSAQTRPAGQGQANVRDEPGSQPAANRPALNITTDAVYQLLSRWENAQDTQNFTAYESCYGYSFKGVLRTTSGRVQIFSFNEWMKDRRRMITQPGGLNVDVKNVRVSVDGDTATVEFDQYYYTASYSDWGPKVIKVQATTDGEKIVYEELKASYRL